MNNTAIDSVYKYAIKTNGVVGTIDGISATFLIKELNDGKENEYDLKSIISAKPFKQGSLISVKDNYYFVIDVEEQFNQSVYNIGTIRKIVKCWYNPSTADITPSSQDSVETYGIIEGKNDVLNNSGGLISVVQDQYTVILKDTDKVEVNYGIMYNGIKYKVTSVNNTVEGLLKLVVQVCGTYDGNVYIISADSPVTLDMGATFQLSPICKTNNVIQTGETINYSVSDTSIATMTTNGLITGVKAGKCTITCTWKKQSCDVVVNVASPTPSPTPSTYSITSRTGDISIKQFSTNTFSVVDSNGVLDTNTWTINVNYNGISTDWVQIVETATNYIKIKNVKGINTLPLKVSFTKDTTVLNIEIKLIR